MIKFLLTSVICLCCLCGRAVSPDSVRMDSVRSRLERLAKYDSACLSEVDLLAGKMSLNELLRHVARVNGMNLNVKGGENIQVSCNFSRACVIDLLCFLCREYRFDLEVTGNIISVFPAPPLPVLPPVIHIEYDSLQGWMSGDWVDKPLVDVVRKISSCTGMNIMLPRPLYEQSVSACLRRLKPEEFLRALAAVNGLEAVRSGNGIWVLDRKDAAGGVGNVRVSRWEQSFTSDQFAVDSTGLITLMVNNVNIQDIISELCRRLRLNYFFTSPLQRPTSVFVKNVYLKELLNTLFMGTDFSYREQEGIFIFGMAEKEGGLMTTRVVPMKYRTITGLVEIIPTPLKQKNQLQPFPDLNSLVVSGEARQVDEIVRFLASIDKSVPLITIDVMIVDVKKSRLQEIGLTYGLGKNPATTSGSLSPGVDMGFSASSINRLINSFNGFGAINLGRVKPDFYLNLKLLEEDGTIEMRSTPKLSTLNGHEANLKSGEMKYYKEVLNNIIGTQNPIQSESYTWKSVEANLQVKIVPMVSLDDHITLDIEIVQSEFTAREGGEKDAPPGTMTRSFKSLIRVKNDEMVLLGGIEKNSRDKTSSGLPFIARIPVLKWIFGQSRNNKIEEKLNVFIKPHVVY